MAARLGPIFLAPLLLAAAGAEPEPTAAEPARRSTSSAHLTANISAALPKYDPAAGHAPAGPAGLPAAAPPMNAIVRLPAYIVRDHRPPSPEEVLTKQGWEADAATRYLGPKDGLDRSLNAVTLADLWKSIPLLGRVPFVPFNSLSNGERAQALYRRIEGRRRWQELLDLGTVAPAKPAKAKAPAETAPKP